MKLNHYDEHCKTRLSVLQEMGKLYIWLELELIAVTRVVARVVAPVVAHLPAVAKTLTRHW